MIVDIYEFVGKMAEQHANLLKVIELQNNSIQALNHRSNALAASQLVIFALLMESDNKQQRGKIATHLRTMLNNPHISSSQYLVAQLSELLDVCEDGNKSGGRTSRKTTPDWFRGVVEGGLSEHFKDQSSKEKG